MRIACHMPVEKARTYVIYVSCTADDMPSGSFAKSKRVCLRGLQLLGDALKSFSSIFISIDPNQVRLGKLRPHQLPAHESCCFKDAATSTCSRSVTVCELAGMMLYSQPSKIQDPRVVRVNLQRLRCRGPICSQPNMCFVAYP